MHRGKSMTTWRVVELRLGTVCSGGTNQVLVQRVLLKKTDKSRERQLSFDVRAYVIQGWGKTVLGRLRQLIRQLINRPTMLPKLHYDFIIIVTQKMIPLVNVSSVGTGVLSPKALGWSDREARTWRMTADVLELEAGRRSEWKINKGMAAGVSLISLGGARPVPRKKGVAWKHCVKTLTE